MTRGTQAVVSVKGDQKNILIICFHLFSQQWCTCEDEEIVPQGTSEQFRNVHFVTKHVLTFCFTPIISPRWHWPAQTLLRPDWTGHAICPTFQPANVNNYSNLSFMFFKLWFLMFCSLVFELRSRWSLWLKESMLDDRLSLNSYFENFIAAYY